LQECKADFIGAHLELAGFEMQKGMPCHDGMSPKLFERFEMVLSGHFHAKSSQGNIHYLGSQMEFFWNDCNDPKHFHVLDTDTRELTAVRNPITIYEKIYYDHENMNKFKDLSYLDSKFVKVIVTNKGDPMSLNVSLTVCRLRRFMNSKSKKTSKSSSVRMSDDEDSHLKIPNRLSLIILTQLIQT
jgi:hypothetical protein